MSQWQPDNDNLVQVIQLLKESQYPCNETQRAIQQVIYLFGGMIGDLVFNDDWRRLLWKVQQYSKCDIDMKLEAI